MVATFLSLLILLGITGKAVMHRYWLAAAGALLIAYVVAGLLAHSLRATWPLISELVDGGFSAVLGVLVAAPLAISLVERRRHADSSPKREVADLFLLVAVVHAAWFLWTLAMS